jgi:hypothetical protein
MQSLLIVADADSSMKRQRIPCYDDKHKFTRNTAVQLSSSSSNANGLLSGGSRITGIRGNG